MTCLEKLSTKCGLPWDLVRALAPGEALNWASLACGSWPTDSPSLPSLHMEGHVLVMAEGGGVGRGGHSVSPATCATVQPLTCASEGPLPPTQFLEMGACRLEGAGRSPCDYRIFPFIVLKPNGFFLIPNMSGDDEIQRACCCLESKYTTQQKSVANVYWPV